MTAKTHLDVDVAAGLVDALTEGLDVRVVDVDEPNLGPRGGSDHVPDAAPRQFPLQRRQQPFPVGAERN
ncbi:MAG: hypothetical protein GX610_03580 [Rhodococcus sp.]|nr:hypothetical protein [Rhodococcus sp. (in: high G+C Gram-positive bacteria)]